MSFLVIVLATFNRRVVCKESAASIPILLFMSEIISPIKMLAFSPCVSAQAKASASACRGFPKAFVLPNNNSE